MSVEVLVSSALVEWFQVHLDKVLADDAPFDICSCQVIDMHLIFNAENLKSLSWWL